jgi:hypothetical protein
LKSTVYEYSILGRGHVEPVAITLKSDRSGFGREAALKEIAAEKLAIRHRLARQREKATDTQDYRVRLARRATERQIERDLRKSQRVCEQLDTSKVNTLNCINMTNVSGI